MRHSRRAGLAIAMAACPAVAHANAGIGFFTPASISLLAALVPVILIEGFVLRWRLPVPMGRSFKLSAVANLASTLLGAVLGVAFDILLSGATGVSGLSGPIGFVISLALMFGITVWIEKRTVARMSPAIPAPLVGRAVLVANAITYALLSVAVFLLVAPEASYSDRSRVTEVINVMIVERAEVLEHYRKTGNFPPARTVEAPTKNTRRLVREADGRILGFIASSRPEIDGRAIVYEPVMGGSQIVGWKCYTPGLPTNIMPAACRFRSAAEALP